MSCPRCGNDRTKVLKTVKTTIIERLRRCPDCGYIWMTVEVPKNDKYLKSYTRSLLDDEGWIKDNALDEDEDDDI